MSDAKLTANRANAQHSTGPRTPEGKARSSMNAVKHGLFAKTLAPTAELFGESRAEFDALLAELRMQYAPRGAEEVLIVEKIAKQWWLQARLSNISQRRLATLVKGGIDFATATQGSFPFDNHELRLERSVSRLRKDLQFLQRLRDGEDCKHTRPVAATFARMTRLHEEEAEATRRRIDAERQREEAANPREGLILVHLPGSISEPPSHPAALPSYPVAPSSNPIAEPPQDTAPSPAPAKLLQRIAADMVATSHDARPLRMRLGLPLPSPGDAEPRGAEQPRNMDRPRRGTARQKALRQAAEPRGSGFDGPESLAASGD